MVLFVLLSVGVFGCDKAQSCPFRDSQATSGSVELIDSPLPPPPPPPPPVVRIPDAEPWRCVASDVGPEDMGVQALVQEQKQLIAAKAKQLDDMQVQLEAAVKAVRKRKKGGKKVFDEWRRQYGDKVPAMKPWDGRAVKSKQAVYPRILREGGEP